MMRLSEKNRKILIEYIHQKLEEYSKSLVREILSENPRFKPFGKKEEEALNVMKENPSGFSSLLEKMLWHNGHDLFFDFFCILDGVGDPEDKEWSDVLLIDKPKDFNEHVEFLHDKF